MKKTDKIKSIFYLLMILLVGYLISLNSKTIPDYSQESIVIVNNTEYDLEPQVKLILNEVLCIDSVSITFEYMDDIYADRYAAFIVEDFFFKHHYAIFMSKNLIGHKLGITLGHELVHLDQFESGDFIQLHFYNGIYIYKGDTINTNFVEHDDRAYEIDAMEREESTYYRIFKSLYE